MRPRTLRCGFIRGRLRKRCGPAVGRVRKRPQEEKTPKPVIPGLYHSNEPGYTRTLLTEAGSAAVLGERFLIKSAAFSAIIMVGAFVLPPGMMGITEASTTRRPSTPWTRNSESTTDALSLPILHVPTG